MPEKLVVTDRHGLTPSWVGNSLELVLVHKCYWLTLLGLSTRNNSWRLHLLFGDPVCPKSVFGLTSSLLHGYGDALDPHLPAKFGCSFRRSTTWVPAQNGSVFLDLASIDISDGK